MLVTVFALVWCALLFAQLIGLAAEWVELRAAAGSARPGHGRIVTWLAAVGAVVITGVAAGAACAVALLADGQGGFGIMLLTVLVFVMAASSISLVLTVLRPTAGGYPGILAEIARHAAQRVSKSDAASIRHRLAGVDAAHASRPRTPPWLRFIPAIIGLAVIVTLVISLTTAHAWRGWWWLSVIALLLPAVSVLIAFGTDRVALLTHEAWSEVYSAQRAVVETELDLLERRASRGVTGLTERVSKALGILREQDAKK